MPQRISVTGCPGSGKSRVGKELARLLGLKYVELDEFHHGPDWEEAQPEELAARVKEVVAGDKWVIDGNYSDVQPLIRERVELIVALDLPRYLVMTRLVLRTFKRLITQEELWNGNKERWGNLFQRNPEENIILWGWTHFDRYHDRAVGAEQNSGKDGWPPVVRLTTPSEVRKFTNDLWTGAFVIPTLRTS